MIDKLEAIKRLLWEDWDPIGVNGAGPDDEYDSYAFRIFVMLSEGSREAEVAEYLRCVATENMGLSDAGACEAIARTIVEIQEKHT